MRKSGDALAKLIEDALGRLKLPAAQLVDQLPGGQVAPATGTTPGVIKLSTSTPASIGTAAAGSSSSASRGDHVHAHGDQAGGSLHAAATTSVAGFLSAADKTKLDLYPAVSGLTAGHVLTVLTASTVGFAASATSVLTTRGDLLTRNATVLSRIGIGTSGQYLRSDGTDPAWATPVGSDINLSYLGSPTYKTVQQMQDTIHSTGWISGGAITDNGNGTVTVAAGTGLIRATDSAVATLSWCNWIAAANVVLTNATTNYLTIDYNSGTPTVAVSTTEPTDYNTKIHLATIYRNGTDLHINAAIKHTIGDHASLMFRAMEATMPFAQETGGMISASGTRNIAITAGAWWWGLTRFTTAAFDSSGAGRFDVYYRNGSGGWTEVSSQAQINNTQYDNGSGTLGTLTANRYGVHWVYLATSGAVYVQYGQGDYTLANAQAAAIPVSPPEVAANSRLIGKIIIQKSAIAFFSVESPLTSPLSVAPITDHNALSGLQGGTTNEYYHLTAAQSTGLGSYTLTVPATGTAALGTGTANQVAYWSDTNTLAGDTGMTYAAASDTLSATRVLMGGATSNGTNYYFQVGYPDTATMIQFGSVAWALRFGSLQAGNQFIATGVEKTAADNNYKAKTGNNSAVNHLIQEFSYSGVWSISGQAYQSDGTTLTPTTVFAVEVTLPYVSIGGLLLGPGLRTSPASPYSKEVYVDANGFLKRAA